MLRFNSSKRPPVRNYLSRGEQWRLLLLVMSLGAVIFAMRAIRRPENIERVALAFGNEAASAQPPAETAPPQVLQERKARPPNAVPVTGSAAEQPSDGKKLAPASPPEEWGSIRDNTYFRSAEKDAWFRLFSILQQSSQEEIDRYSTGEVGYMQLVDQPAAYRGKLVTLRGTLRQMTVQQPAQNDIGLKSYYRLVLQPRDGDIWPVFVYCLDPPDGLPSGTEVGVDLSATGFFFKNLSYEWEGGLGVAPVILAKNVVLSGAPPTVALPAAPAALVTSDGSNGADRVGSQPIANAAPKLHEVLSLAGWDEARFARFTDGVPTDEVEREQLMELLWRVNKFDPGSIDAWTQTRLTVARLLDGPAEHRGEMLRLIGRIVRVERSELEPRDASRFELPAYFNCSMELQSNGGRALIIVPRVPKDWQEMAAINEPASARALFVKTLTEADGTISALFVAKRIEWQPTVPREPHTSFGEAVLGRLGMDVGLFDEVRSRGPILVAERDAFYNALEAVSHIGAIQLVRFSQENLSQVRARWLQERQTATGDSRRALAREVVRRAEGGLYSVAPLFLEPEQHVGELVALEGVARRVVRIDVGMRPDRSGPSDIARRFGIDYYYEMEVFPDDSQNNPVVFCVRELPNGFPTGDGLHVPVRVAGFFFKDWLYTTRGTTTPDGDDAGSIGPRTQYAPLLVGHSPLILTADQGRDKWAQAVGGGLFLLALSGIGVTVWWFARTDLRFAQRIPAARFSLAAGESLNELNLVAGDEPINHSGQPESSPRGASGLE